MSEDHPRCNDCGEPYTPSRKWNGGNPITVMLPNCSCEDLIDNEMILKLEARARRIRD